MAKDKAKGAKTNKTKTPLQASRRRINELLTGNVIRVQPVKKPCGITASHRLVASCTHMMTIIAMMLIMMMLMITS